VSNNFRMYLGFSLLLTCSTPAFGKSVPVQNLKSNLQITLRIHDYVHIQPETLARAEAVSSEILHDAGVEVFWLNCDTALPVEKREPACARPLGRLDFVLNLVDRIQLLSPKLREIAMGLAMVPPDGSEGSLAYLSTRQATGVAHEYSTSLEIVLGLGAAHELGHLLLGEDAHTPSGLMKARWSNDELKHWSSGSLTFTSEQARRIQSNLLVREEEALKSPGEIQIAKATGTEH